MMMMMMMMMMCDDDDGWAITRESARKRGKCGRLCVRFGCFGVCTIQLSCARALCSSTSARFGLFVLLAITKRVRITHHNA
eukprot:2985850-Rhodomonas_salina.1